MRQFLISLALAVTTFIAQPAAVQAPKNLCCGAKLAMTFGEASPDVKIVMLVLWAVAIASVVVWVRALAGIRKAPSDGAPRTVAFLEAWRGGGPLLGLAIALGILTNQFVAMYAYLPVASYREYAPEWAEFAMIASAGFLAGAIATLTCSHLKGRISAVGLPGGT